MKKALFDYIALLISEYPDTEEYIAKRENELMNRFENFRDENVGGGRAQYVNNEGVANMAISIADDRHILNLKRNAEAVENCLNDCDSLTRKIIYELYIRRPQKYTLDGVAGLVHLSKSQIVKRRRIFFEEIAKRRGL